ncbi:uncharacterized protein [Littorina saxatilis]|uniref:uncharacterized protein n=1 Tax=Littorina saxatilis TaxID=31220 RepID=UPI0038B5E264
MYHLVLPVDESVNGTYVWSSSGGQFKRKALNIILVEPTQITKTNNPVSSADITSAAHTTLLHPEAATETDTTVPLSAVVAACVSLGTVAIIGVLLKIVGSIRRNCEGRRLRPEQDIPLHELRQLSLPEPQQRDLPDIPFNYQVPPQRPSAASVLVRDRRRHRSEESSLYETVGDDWESRIADGRASLSAPDVRVSGVPADYLHPAPSAREAADVRAWNPLYENCSFAYFKPRR